MDLRGILVSLNGGNSWFKQCEGCDDYNSLYRVYSDVINDLLVRHRSGLHCRPVDDSTHRGVIGVDSRNGEQQAYDDVGAERYRRRWGLCPETAGIGGTTQCAVATGDTAV